MKKMLKIIAMLLVIAAVISAAGCAGKDTKTDNENQGVSNQTSPEVVETTPAETPTETPEVVETTPVETPEVTNNTIGNTTGNITAQNGTHMSNTQRKMAIAQNRTKSSDTENVSQNDSQ
jgi:hypothetical protein